MEWQSTPVIRIAKTFQKRLLRWFHTHRRDLPWRFDPTPYKVWLSEIMLQQTQVKTVLPYYARFLERFPNIESLARAPEQEVLELWSGLGYYSRARNMQKAAKQILQQYGAFPEDFNDILSLPGIGRYTAGAICSIAFNQPQPIVDGNIRRVLARLNGIKTAVPESHFWEQMIALIPRNHASAFNQAMMELGALICIPSQPHCALCPVKSLCTAFKLGLQNSIPQVKARRPPESARILALVLEHEHKLLAVSSKPDFIPGQWGFPCVIVSDQESPEVAASRLSRSIAGKKIRLIRCAEFKHSITHYRISISAFYGKLGHRDWQLKYSGEYCWLPYDQIGKRIISSLFRKILHKCEVFFRPQD